MWTLFDRHTRGASLDVMRTRNVIPTAETSQHKQTETFNILGRELCDLKTRTQTQSDTCKHISKNMPRLAAIIHQLLANENSKRLSTTGSFLESFLRRTNFPLPAVRWPL